MNAVNTIEQLRTLRLQGMAIALEKQLSQPAFSGASFEQRIQMLVDAENSHRDTQRYKRILKNARLKVQSLPEDLDYRPGRGLEKSVVTGLLSCAWIWKQQNLLITGPAGTGKTFLSCALGLEAARHGLTVAYRRTARLLEEMAIAHEDGSIGKMRSQLMKTQLLILDDFGLNQMTSRGRADLLELLDDRVGASSTIVLGQMPVKEWHGFINDPALADAILDRLVHSSHKIALKGESMRKLKAESDQ